MITRTQKTMPERIAAAVICILLVACPVCLTACVKPDKAVVGTWTLHEVSNYYIANYEYTFRSDGTADLTEKSTFDKKTESNTESGEFTAKDGELVFTPDDELGVPQVFFYSVSEDGNTLTLTYPTGGVITLERAQDQ